MFSKIAKAVSRAIRPGVRVQRTISARYDAAQTTDDNRRHWANADGLSPNAAIAPEIRRKLRERCRYEVANNSYAKGIGLTVANDTVGIGPTLQVLTDDSALNDDIEKLVYQWLEEAKIAAKLRQMRFARYDSGEAFAVFGTNRGMRGPIKIDVSVIETDQIADPVERSIAPYKGGTEKIDGIEYDAYGNPVVYHKLKSHPGSTTWNPFPTESDPINAEFVFHYFRGDRPGQLRGIPEITAAVRDFADLRRFTLATIAAAETAAEHAGMIETDAPANQDASDEQEGTGPKVWDTVEIEKRAAVVMPAGYKMSQLKPEHPSTTYREFVNAKLNEIARCLCVPFHIAAMDPSLANMSSSYVVGQMYTKERLLDRSELECFLEKALRLVLREAFLLGLLAEDPDNIPHEWHWPSLSHHADPAKVANAAAAELGAGITTYAIEFSKKGLDAKEQMTKQAELLGWTLAEYQEALRNKLFGPPPTEKPTDEDPEDEETPKNGNGHASRFALNR